MCNKLTRENFLELIEIVKNEKIRKIEHSEIAVSTRQILNINDDEWIPLQNQIKDQFADATRLVFLPIEWHNKFLEYYLK